ncbi:hypothetical protein Poli38472_005057 [Pythium oligandrum]|uniref:Transmembrane protein n=1 Tax=Pythium oligandrum TaxID=41045 RepID=A0A8K1CFD3_PYTOL|nr:hypothetical protein Poli38472_005057 [Pythium oligandrum]|eukprot:TMW62439.1 hypothetical protein Poli38472_005057 [Pythium oligandrum]
MQAPFHKFESPDSVTYLGQDGSTGSSVSTSIKGKPLSELGEEPSSLPTSLTVAVSIRRGRLLLLTLVVLAVIVGVVLTLAHGVELLRFNARSKDTLAREKLLDQYNSYSGTVATALGKPVEIFVAVLAQLIILRLMAEAYTRPVISKWQILTPIALSVAVGFMLNNGFGAANVQLREDSMRVVILASDLSVPSGPNAAVAARMTTVSQTVSETTPRNLITNTVLRNAVLPRVTFKQTLCDWEETQYESLGDDNSPLPTVDYGFTQRDWQSRILQEALPAETLKLVVNATKKTANDGLKSADLPMNASLAADLFLYMMIVAPTVFPWGSFYAFQDNESASSSISKKSSVVAGLLPPSETASETEQREWFLRAANASVTRQFAGAVNTSRRDIGVEFSHVEISPSIHFDAVTLEVEIDPRLLASKKARNNATRQTLVYQAGPPGAPSNCGPWPALCLVEKPMYLPKPSSFIIDALQQVHAFSTCASQLGDTLMASDAESFVCNESSNSSIMVMSVGKRLAADSLVQNETYGTAGEDYPTALITNLRKVYTFTIGRLSWRLENLATVYGAECGTSASTPNCSGLHLPLSTSTLSAVGLVRDGPAVEQHLVVSAEALPTDLIMPSTLLGKYKPRAVPLVEVSEWPSQTRSGGDILLPHNIDKLVWANTTVTDQNCDAKMEGLLYTKLNNHMYIEHGFQTAYTAATFFLLQNAVVKDVVSVPQGAQATTLDFDGNIQEMVALVSTPSQNAVLTLVGCGVLLLCVLWAVIKTSTNQTDPLGGITAPQAIARVMLDDLQFPALLLHRRVTHHDGEACEPRKLDEFTIAQLTIVHEADVTHV